MSVTKSTVSHNSIFISYLQAKKKKPNQAAYFKKAMDSVNHFHDAY